MRQQTLKRLAQGWGVLVPVAVALAIAISLRQAAAEPLPSPRPFNPDADGKPSWRLMGVASCSAAACHNYNGPQGTKRSEYSTWIDHDQHARAYSVLFSEQSCRITKNLKAELPAHENTLCLKCHVSQSIETDRLSPRLEIADGVHCENCHGPAEGWLTTHYLPSWQGLSETDKIALGFKPMKDLLTRAQSCVDCHVGSPRTGADVNHDLIAAGHPRLNFEFSNYLAIYKRHWSLAEDKQRYPDFEARAWAIGQVVSAKQALELLAWRAENKDGARPWPELAEYDCFACHQGLTEKVKRTEPTSPLRPLGRPAWNTWYLASPRALAVAEGNRPDRVLASLDQVQLQMKDLGANRHRAQMEAGAAAEALEDWMRGLDHQPADPTRSRGLFVTLLQEDPHRAAGTWDSSAQRYLVLVALYRAMRDQGSLGVATPEVKACLDCLHGNLMFEAGLDSPARGYDPGRVVPILETLRGLPGR